MTTLYAHAPEKLERLLTRLFGVEEINGHGICPTYLYRWTLLKIGSLFSVYLHKFVGDDWSLDLHDHPKRFWSIGLRGQYTESTPRRLYVSADKSAPTPPSPCRCPACWPREITRVFRAPWIRTFPADHVHRLTGPTPEHPCWTLVIVGRATRAWGFWRGLTWVPWKQYVNSADAKAQRSCP